MAFQLDVNAIYCQKRCSSMSDIKEITVKTLLNEILYTIWYHLYNLKAVKNTHGGMLVLVKLQALACNFIKSTIPPWVFFTAFKLYKWYQIAQRITNVSMFRLLLYHGNLAKSLLNKLCTIWT